MNIAENVIKLTEDAIALVFVAAVVASLIGPMFSMAIHVALVLMDSIKGLFEPMARRAAKGIRLRSVNVVLTDGAPLPRHAREGDAGMDLTTRQTVTIQPHETVKVGTGVRFEIPEGYYGSVVPRSSVATKRGITIANVPGTIDSHYRGEIMLPLHNIGTDAVTVERGERVAQLIIQQYLACQCIEVEELSETERGEGGFGSTGV